MNCYIYDLSLNNVKIIHPRLKIKTSFLEGVTELVTVDDMGGISQNRTIKLCLLYLPFKDSFIYGR